MQRASTHSEQLLWSRLCARQLGVTFRRQLVIGGRFIVDFAAPAVRLVVEVDGGYHRERHNADARRDRALAWLGWRVVRVEVALVERELEAAVRLVREAAAGD
jgi:very-short-patch-repair endonuclease